MPSQTTRLSTIAWAALILTVFMVAGGVRLYGLDWDEGTHLHPDERYLTMVVSAVRFPGEILDADGRPSCQGRLACLSLYLDTEASPLNPANHEAYTSYVYGTFPLLITRAVALGLDALCLGEACMPGFYAGYNGIHLVGRALSTAMDLATLTALIGIGWLLYDRWTGALAGALYALAVLPIQHTHFFVVDSFATVFVTWSLFFCVLAVRAPGYWRAPAAVSDHALGPLNQVWWLLPAGLMTGLAVASKVSVWPLAGLVALCGLVAFRGSAALERSFGALALSGGLAVVAFRLAQPYAFMGPGFFDVRINPHWLSTMREVSELMRGLRDVPYGHQWTSRTPLIFPWVNMVFWGLGLPLGLSAWVGWGAMGWQLFRGRHIAHLLPWVWGTAFFLYQATQWVKSMRYLLPVYPVFVLFAAWLAMRLGRRWHSYRRPAASGDGVPQTASASLRRRLLGLAIPVTLLAATALWARAFLSIYAQPVTRIEASRWIFENVPTAVMLRTTDGDTINVPLRSDVARLQEGAGGVAIPLSDVWTPSEARGLETAGLQIAAVVLPKMSGDGVAGARALSARLGSTVTRVEVLVAASGTLAVEMAFDPPVTVRVAEDPILTLVLEGGAPVSLQTSVIANEHWDDPLPLRTEGRDPFWNWYEGLSSSPTGQMNLYDNDTPEKRLSLLAWLDEADYIVLSSNRLYASIPRLPQRYPLTTAYYESLMKGSLGYELVAEFVSYPSLAGCQFPDQEIPFARMEPQYTNAPACTVPYPPAEEAFSVYDHPTVLIFRRTPAYSRDAAQALLPRVLVETTRWVTPRQATIEEARNVETLLASPRMRLKQEQGGAWSAIFNRNAWHNRFQQLAVVSWALLLTLLGWIAFPLVQWALPDLRHGAYGLARIVGLLVWAYVAWLLASLRILPHTRAVLWFVLGALAMVSAAVAYVRRDSLQRVVRESWRDILIVDLVFLTLFLAWTGVRWLNPDLWHPNSGGEKPMDFAYFNAVIRSTWFPPYDPWFAGGNLNYYYFGFVMMGSLTEALGIVPSVAYNLAVASLFALTGVGAATIAGNLAGGDDARGRRAGLWGLLLVLVMGNLGEVHLLAKGFIQVGSVQFESLIPGYPEIISLFAGLWKVVALGDPLPFRPEWWYWNATRIIPVLPGEVGPINEFPAFTFLYADLHAHMMALPLTQIALAVALQWAVGGSRAWKGVWERQGRKGGARWWPAPALTLLLSALVAGALRATNTWDYPTYLALMSVGLWVGLTSRGANGEPSQGIRNLTKPGPGITALLVPVLLFGLAELLFRPFTANYQGAYAAFEGWQGSRTPLITYLWMYGQFLFPIVVGGLISLGLGAVLRIGRGSAHAALPYLAVVAGLTAATLLFVGYLWVSIAWLAIPLGGLAAVLVLAQGVPVRRRVLWFWVGTALALSLLVEASVLKGDIGRMNTVFKFHLQVWMLLGLAAAVFVERLVHGPRPLSPVPEEQRRVATSRDLVAAILALLVFGAALYPAFAIPAKVRERWASTAPHTLDGAAYLPYSRQFEQGHEINLAADARVIRWLQDHVEGSPTIIEGLGEREYLWGNRISVYTGLPAVVGWRWHQVQQRMVMPPGTVEARQQDVRQFYNTSDAARARGILEKHQVRYVIHAPYERAYMLPAGERKFTEMVANGWLEVVYQDADATIYRVQD